ncbi:hypothetical protein MEO41_28915, partial [Dolichospermum sp. ST_sed4]|nr:hypothetical protein [Dolichospermum sp. ST_sed4]
KGDVLVLGGQLRRDALGGDMDPSGIFGDLFKELGQMGFGEQLNQFSNMGVKQIKFVVVNTNPNQPVVVTENTEVELSNKAMNVVEEGDKPIPDITYEDIGG